jgi:hypothetical protein
MRVPVHLAALLILTLSACSSTAAPTSTIPAEINQPVLPGSPTAAASPRLTSTPISTATATLTPTSLPSPTTTPSPSPEPSPTSTPIGGGSGILLLETCPIWYDCEPWQLSLSDGLLVRSNQPYLRLEVVKVDPFKFRMVLHNPSTGATTAVLHCPDDMYSCHQSLISGSLQDDHLYLAQAYQRRLYDGNKQTDLYRLNTSSLELTLVDQFAGSIWTFHPLSKGLQGLMGFEGNAFQGELLLYDLETLQRSTLVARRGQFLLYGAHPDEQTIWYRITDYCETELVAAGGQRIAQIKDSDGIIGWIDDENFLIFTASNNPPICTHTGIALANRYGLTGQWITTSLSYWAELFPEHGKLFFTSECNNKGCMQLMSADLDGSNPQLVLESPQRFFGDLKNGLVSTDGTFMLFSTGKQVWMINLDGSPPQILLNSDREWHLVGWLDK